MTSVVDTVAGAVREAILDGRLAAGARLPEAELVRTHGAARHTVRAALRGLAAEGLVVLEPNRGATVARLDGEDVVALYELRTALEVEAAHLALQRHAGRMPARVHQAAERFATLCRDDGAPWAAVSEAHGDLHTAIVRAARSPRISEAHAQRDAEIRLFLLRVRTHLSRERMADDHLRLVTDLESRGPDALRDHLRVAAAELVDELEA